ncbi:MAG: rhodanese-like domain-containing protein [Desulfobacterales bacterium]|nr:rhodanese-like domain-containing protein [Desulfobacterales bacterium]
MIVDNDINQSTQQELDKKIFHLKSLFETAKELEDLIQPQKIIDTFLLMTMGSFGICKGMGALINTQTHDGDMAIRGFSLTDSETLKKNMMTIYDYFFPKKDFSGGPSVPTKVIIKNDFAAISHFPSQITILIFFTMDEVYSGFIGLGETTCFGQSITEEDEDTLLSFSNVLISALSQALFKRNIRQLNADLRRKNSVLQKSLDEITQIRKELDQEVFHLKTLYDLTAELSPIMETEKLLKIYLLMLMGSFSMTEGFILLYNVTLKTFQLSTRGIKPPVDFDSQSIENVLYNSFLALENKILPPMSMERIPTPELFVQYGLNGTFKIGLMFLVDFNYLGLIGLGSTCSDQVIFGDSDKLLNNCMKNFLVYLKNTILYETTQNLNTSLNQRNEDLQQTISKLTAAMYRISILEKAGERIKSIVQGETKRISRASIWDFGLIIFFSIILGIIFNMASPNAIPLLDSTILRNPPIFVDAETVKKKLAEDTILLVDARPKSFYSQTHIKGAINIPASLFDLVYMMMLSNMDTEKEIVIYGRNISKHYDEEVAYQLKQRGHENIKVMIGNMDVWEKEGFPMEEEVPQG